MTQDGWRDSELAKASEDAAVARAEARRRRRAPNDEEGGDPGTPVLTRREAAEAHAARYVTE